MLIVMVLALASQMLITPAVASASIPSVFDGAVSCSTETDGVRYCGENDPPATPRTTAPSFDDAPIDVTAAFPPEPESGPDGDFPLVMLFHGYGGSKFSLSQMQHYVDLGYATFSMSDRGFHESCGTAASVTAGGADCDGVYIRLIDNRYEVRDAQFYAGQLVDEGLVDPEAIGATGGSYGGGMSMALGALKDRVVNEDYSLAPWTSPEGTPLHMAATAPVIPWTDLSYSLAPNGSTLDYVADAPYTGPAGVQKQSFVTGLYGAGSSNGRYAAEGADPTADVTGWRNLLNAGEPYGSAVQDVMTEMTTHHSSYYIDHSQAPAPMLMSSGFTDDLFPVDEIIRYYNRTKTEYPNADIAMTMGDFGHMRGQNKGAEMAAVNQRIDDWFAYYLKGEGSKPDQGVVARAQTCPSGAAPGEAHTAATWAQMTPGEVRMSDAAEKVIGADSTTAGQFNPIFAAACASVPDVAVNGAATYEFDAAPAGGYTMMGAATVIADFKLGTDTSQVAARLLDVAPGGTETLVDRGLWRPATGGDFNRQAFQLHPNGWTFAEGHTPKLELIGNDGVANDASGLLGYGRPSDGQGDVTVRNLEARIPVIEKPGALGGVVKAPAAKFLPDGYELAAGFAGLKSPKLKLKSAKLKVKGGKAKATLICPDAFDACHDGKLTLTANDKYKGKKASFKAGSAKFDTVEGHGAGTAQVKLTKKAKKFLKKKKSKLKVEAAITIAELDSATTTGAKLVRKK